MSFIRELRPFPFLRFLFPLVIGILLGEYSSFLVKWVVSTGGFCFFLLCVMMGAKRIRNSFHLRALFGVLTMGVFVALGAGLVSLQKSNMSEFPSSESDVLVVGYVNEPPVVKEKTIRCLFRLESCLHDSVWASYQNKVIVYLEKDSLSEKLITGDRLLLAARFQRVRNAGNPDEFDYARYLQHQHVLFQSNQKAGSWKLLDGKGGFHLKRLAMSWRRKLLAIYRENGMDADAYGVLAALTLGYRQELNPEIREAWASAGAMHVLAVSGLHVGIIYMILHTLLRFLSRYWWGKWLRAFILLTALWFYALLTGLSPSVLRAATMFSFIVVGQSMKRTVTIYNSLAVSAFFLLLSDPFLLFAVGFQLSYLAVLSIVFFQPRIYRLMSFENYPADKVWALTTVGVAAQLGTFPLSVYYFHQFPMYFLLTNVVVIPFAGLLIYLAILLFIFSSVNWLAKTLTLCLQFSFRIMNSAIDWIKDLPGSLWQGISIEGFQVWGIYLSIALITFYVIRRKSGSVFVFLSLLLALQLPELINHMGHKPKGEFVVYNFRGQSVYEWSYGGQAILLADSLTDFTRIAKLTQPHHLRLKVDSVYLARMEAKIVEELPDILFTRNDAFLNLGDRRCAFVREKGWSGIHLAEPIRVDYLVLGRNAPLYPEDICAVFHVDTIVLDATNSPWYRQRWKKCADTAHFAIHDVLLDGAFVVNICVQEK